MGVLVAGMHRSGTSMVGRLLREAGLTMSPGDGEPPLHEALPENPRGFFERSDVVTFDEDWLNRMGGAWWAPPRVSESEWRALDHRSVLTESRGRLDVLSAAVDHQWFVKDPRISLILPLWDRLCLQELPVVLCVRSPAEVASSLNVRDGMLPRFGLALWAQYNVELIRSLGSRPSLVLDYVRSLGEPREACRALTGFVADLGVVPAREPGDLAPLMERELRRHGLTELAPHDAYLAQSLEPLYRILTDAHTAVAPGSCPSPPGWVAETIDELRERYAREVDSAELAGRHQRVAAELATVTAERDQLALRLAHVEAALLESRRAVGNPRPFDGSARALVAQFRTRNRVATAAITPAAADLPPAVWTLVESGLLDREWYQRRNADISAAGADPLTHYWHTGWRERRDPSAWFSVSWYLQQYPDVADAGVEPLYHYLTAGWHEGRQPTPIFDLARFAQKWPESTESGVCPLEYRLALAWLAGEVPD